MSIPYQHVQKIPLNQQAMPPTERDLAGCDAVLLILPAGSARISRRAFPHAAFLAQRARQRRPGVETGKETGSETAVDWNTELPNPLGTRLHVAYVKPGLSVFEQLSAARARKLLQRAAAT